MLGSKLQRLLFIHQWENTHEWNQNKILFVKQQLEIQVFLIEKWYQRAERTMTPKKKPKKQEMPPEIKEDIVILILSGLTQQD